jgi:hypothetical protein
VSVAFQTYERFRTPRTHEWMMRVGDPRTPPVLFVPPLLEELNRTRALIAAAMRALALEGHCGWLPDLGGTSESLLPLEEVTWDDWRNDVTAAAEHVTEASGRLPLVASIRGGALIDDAAAADCRWRFAPATGASLARDLDRASLGGGAEWAGYHLAQAGAAGSTQDCQPGAAFAAAHRPPRHRRGARGRQGEGRLLAPLGTGDLRRPRYGLARDIRHWRRQCALLTFSCGEEQLSASLDEADGAIGVVMVMGGSQTRVGRTGCTNAWLKRWRDTAIPASARPAGRGRQHGEDPGFLDSGPISRGRRRFPARGARFGHIVGFGCATARRRSLFMASRRRVRPDPGHPWLVEASSGEPPPAAIRSHYRQRLLSVAAGKAGSPGASTCASSQAV